MKLALSKISGVNRIKITATNSETGEPVKDATITLKSIFDGINEVKYRSVLPIMKTNSKGEYLLDYFDSGTYAFEAVADGYGVAGGSITVALMNEMYAESEISVNNLIRITVKDKKTNAPLSLVKLTLPSPSLDAAIIIPKKFTNINGQSLVAVNKAGEY
ncbi:carboxypeptidase regulatory-like domain-containing protein, partial [Candidatus Micrarchaeota archaeon]|nr:carboxypeptidase regulatory-like domain-containing protein [Candidatus Micrarchaeota archaeon]